jgi:predicted PhzF superfamily epimerase YddE/YHI9
MTTLPIYQVDAFTDRLFGGNPAAVCPLESWLPDEVLQSIAAENNLAETAYFVGGNGRYELRWFTPEVEVALCGHATLASAHVIWRFLEPDAPVLRFDTRRSGELAVTRDGDWLTLDFPVIPVRRETPPLDVSAALRAQPAEVLVSRDLLAVFETEDEVRALNPDMQALMGLERGLIATAPGRDCDFVSRFFAPAAGIPEDPVTGSAHCILVPYWAERLGKTDFLARQVSQRGGVLKCRLAGERVLISGQAVLYLTGEICIPGAP